MLKIIAEKWRKNRAKLKNKFETTKELNLCNYKDIVKMTFDVICNDDKENKLLDCKHITQIDNGHYQGTLIYLIPFDTYQPAEYNYLMTYVGYGSCSGCDTLMSILEYNEGELLTSKQVKDFMRLALDIMRNTIKPYNEGWRHDEDFDTIEFKG